MMRVASGRFSQELVNALLPVGDAKAAARADRYPNAPDGAVRQGFLVDQRVVKDDLGTCQHVDGAHGQQVCGARPGADEIHFAASHSESSSCSKNSAD